MNTIKKGKWLACGCCGESFQTWEGYIDQDQDCGYGICKRCQGWIKEKEDRDMDRAINTLRNGLNEQNREQFDDLDREIQEALVYQALDEGMMSYTIRKAS